MRRLLTKLCRLTQRGRRRRVLAEYVRGYADGLADGQLWHYAMRIDS